MNISLQRLLAPVDNPEWVPSAADWNSLLDEIRERRALIEGGFNKGKFAHPFQVRVRHDGNGWRVYVRTGFVNDSQVFYVYEKHNDSRDWTMPNWHRSANSAGLYAWRSFEEEPKPYLTISTELSGESTNIGLGLGTAPDLTGWHTVLAVRRPKFFCTEERWQKDLYLCYVFAAQGAGDDAQGHLVKQPHLDPKNPDLKLRNQWFFAIGAGSRLTTKMGVRPYIELARLYLLRDPDTGEQELFVQQRVFWNFGAGFNETEDLTIPDDIGGGEINDWLVSLIRDFLSQAADASTEGNILDSNIAVSSEVNTTQYWTQ